MSLTIQRRDGRYLLRSINQLLKTWILCQSTEKSGEQEFKDFLLDGLLDIAFEQLKDPFVVAIPHINLKDVAGEPKEGEPQINLPNKDLVIFPESIEQVLGFTYIQADLKVQDPVPK